MGKSRWKFAMLAMALATGLPLAASPLRADDFPVAPPSSVTAAGVAASDLSALIPPDRSAGLAILQNSTALSPALFPSASPRLSTDPILAADLPANDESIYATPPPPKEDEGINAGGAHFDVDFAYSNRYVYRGVDHSTVSSRGNSLNLLLEGQLSFDLGPYPHPFFGLFTDIEDNDPVSRFQEVRPYVGATWNFRPFLLEGGQISYLYPQREEFNTAEAYAKITLDDSWILRSSQPLLSPYFQASYDYQNSSGWYFEAGVKHDFIFDDIGLTITLQSDVAYINHLKQLFVFVNTTKESGWQHAEVGLTATYSLNSLLNIARRYGEFDVKGYVFYDDKLSNKITANNVVWAGTGISFRY